ncbi:MAG: PSD1 domain-containing protein [Planctomycetaceae bacterium]|nr:PSD1 domain-containing protein [Planctomycetaceae bacterium]
MLRDTIFFLLLIMVMRDATAEELKLTADDLQFFETKIRPVLVQHCYECHSTTAAEAGGKLLLDSRDALLLGGEAGSVLVAGHPEASLIIQALRYDGIQMPPDNPLPDAVINDFAEWIRRGAPDPRSSQTAESEIVHGDAEELWAYRPVRPFPVPEVKEATWPRDPLDKFVQIKFEAAGLTPARDADPRSLIRRLHIDLTGLPPTFETIAEFVAAYPKSPEETVAHTVDKLLLSPQFGERWGRHWLDVARYAESNGNDGLGRNPSFPHAWRYRDYVIEAFNADTPYDRFLTEQLAGDLLPTDAEADRDRHLIATGFLALAAKPAKAMNVNFDMDVVADQIDLVGRGIMGISVGCARCHDHKFDPIPTRDYYALAGIFTSTETMWGTAAHEGLTAPATDLHVLKTAAKVAPPDDFVETVLVLQSDTGIPKPIPEPKWPVGTPLAMGVRDTKQPADCKLNIKGEAHKPGDSVPRGFLTACQFDDADIPEVNGRQSGRLELARWLTHRNHPLTARVMVNRIWLHLFGEGIVRTPDDFGIYGERPTHPELLDYLAVRFIEEGWSIRRMIRNIVLSRTYRLSSTADEALRIADPGNTFMTRHERRRMDAETLRDSMLKVSGQLDLTPGNGSIIRHRDILINLAGNLHQPSNHRSIYLCYLRSSPPPELAAFDLPDFTAVTGKRDVSTIPGQALHLYNNPLVIAQAQHFSARVLKTTEEPVTRIRFAWQQAFGRDPTPDELAEADEFLRITKNELGDISRTWASLCQALLVTNEFRYVD